MLALTRQSLDYKEAPSGRGSMTETLMNKLPKLSESAFFPFLMVSAISATARFTRPSVVYR
jgi:hypothetical protein